MFVMQTVAIETVVVGGAALQMFECPHHAGRLRLSVPACAEQWRRAAAAEREDPMYHCRGCAIGAAHAGESPRVVVNRHRCVRCGSRSTRLIGHGCLYCPSCYNRQREYVLGANGRGGTPIQYHPPHVWDTDLGIFVGVGEDEVKEAAWRLLEEEVTEMIDYGPANAADIRGFMGDHWMARPTVTTMTSRRM